MAKRKRRTDKDRDAHGGSLGGAILLGLLSALLGLFLGIAHLASQPVQTVRNLPSEQDREPETVYYVTGSDRGGAGFRVVEGELLSGAPMDSTVTELELNAWSRANFRFDSADTTTAGPGIIGILPATPNFRIADDLLQIGMELKVSAFGQERAMIYQARGVLQRNGEYLFVPEAVYLGAARIPPFVLAPLLNRKLLRPFELAENWQSLHSAWASLSEVSIEGNELRLVRR